jgi:hypothetical protein
MQALVDHLMVQKHHRLRVSHHVLVEVIYQLLGLLGDRGRQYRPAVFWNRLDDVTPFFLMR